MEVFFKPVVFSIFFVFLFSCSDDTYDEKVSDIPDWDYSEAVTDSGETGNDSDPGDSGDSSHDSDPSDTGYDDSTEDPDEETHPGEYCGNRKVDKATELCDTYPIDCKELSVHFRNTGSALCEPDCKKYDLSLCEKMETRFGATNVSFRTEYILDYGKIESDIESLGTLGIQPYPAFIGLFDPDNTLPPEEAVISQAFAATKPGRKNPSLRQTFVYQFSFNAAGDPVSPVVELEFPEGAIVKEEYQINTFDIMGLFPMARFRLLKLQGDSYCVLAMGYSGNIKIKEAWQDNPVEGGTLEIFSNDVDFYPPDELPNLSENYDEVPEEILFYPECQ